VSTALDPALQNTYTRQRPATSNVRSRANFGIPHRRRVERPPAGSRHGERQPSIRRLHGAGLYPRSWTRWPRRHGGRRRHVHRVQPCAEYVNLTPINITRNLSDANSDYYTWEVTATRRETGRWSLLASFAETWRTAKRISAPERRSRPTRSSIRWRSEHYKPGRERSTRPSDCPANCASPPYIAINRGPVRPHVRGHR